MVQLHCWHKMHQRWTGIEPWLVVLERGLLYGGRLECFAVCIRRRVEEDVHVGEIALMKGNLRQVVVEKARAVDTTRYCVT